MCGLPVRKPSADQLLFERRNGNFLLQITGHPEFGLPYGQDRLVPIYLATLAVQQKSQAVQFRSGAEMLDTFGMSKGGKEYRRLSLRSCAYTARVRAAHPCQAMILALSAGRSISNRLNVRSPFASRASSLIINPAKMSSRTSQ